MELSSYGSVYNIGHKAIDGIWDNEVVIEEKIDGSQFSFGVVGTDLFVRSKGSALYFDSDGKCNQAMFQKAVDTAFFLFHHGLINNGTTYYGEYLQKPKHNVLNYSRIPAGYIIIFDVMIGDQVFLSPEEKKIEAGRIGLECVPLLHIGRINDFEGMKLLLERESILGNTLIEGFVVKNYNKFTVDKKYMKGKFVSEAFKETHNKKWKTEGNKKEITQLIIETLRNPVRWEKAVIHLKERGELTNSPKDIGALIIEAQTDISKEETEWIKDQLYKHFRGTILRGSIAGLPEWYKERLAKESFG